MGPLSTLCGGNSHGKLHPTPVLLKLFKKGKVEITQKVVLTFPDPNKHYNIFTDTSDL